MPELATAARPYARAAFESAKAHDALAQWSRALAALAAAVSDPSVRQLIGNPRHGAQQIAGAIIETLGGLLDMGPRLRNFVRLLAANRRLELATGIAALFECYCIEDRNTNVIEIVSARPLDESQQAALCNAVEARTGRKTTATCRVDTSLLGGASVRIDDLVIDGSLKTRLEKLSQVLVR